MLTNYTLYIYFILIPIVSFVLLLVNILLSTSNVYSDKTGPFECGLTSFNQTRLAFNVSFILVAILFLPFDLELSSILPFSLNLYHTNIYGLFIMIIFTIILSFGFIYEINSNAIYITKNHIKKPNIIHYNNVNNTFEFNNNNNNK
uniref:NADH-ubiquinone oxidoreductase chain 3 n=1 Tax=Blastobotrys adeninivorans TaxID=409370 RepID=A0A060RCV4_BLAAD